MHLALDVEVSPTPSTKASKNLIFKFATINIDGKRVGFDNVNLTSHLNS